jgi:hypothetical protein
MDDKLFAPKPIRKVKIIITEFERLQVRISSHTPTCGKRRLNLKEDDGISYACFEKDIRDSSTTSEILSILGSTAVDSLDEECFRFDEFRTSMPPMRPSNPFYKNLGRADELNDVNYFDSICKEMDPK